jgi:glycosyltransferase involved in cell wall biosynthesis
VLSASGRTDHGETAGVPAAGGRRPRLLFVVNNAAFFASHRLCIGIGARDVGFQVHVAAAPSPALEALRGHGFTVHPIPLHRKAHDPAREARTLVALLQLYRRLRPDVVHHVTVKPVLYGSIAARLAGVPAVVNAVSGLGYVFLARGALARLRRTVVLGAYRLGFGHPNLRVIFQNDDDAALFVEGGLLDPDRVVMIRGSGVDLDRFRPVASPAGTPVVVLPSRMLFDKGVGEFVAAARALRAAGVAARFVLVGEPDPGNPASVSHAQLDAWQSEGMVEWWGPRRDMPEVLGSSQVVCLPSYREGMPKVLLEAAASGRAIVTTDVPGCRDAIVPGVTGLLVPVRDSGALAQALDRLLTDQALRQRLGDAGRRRAEELFAERLVVQRTLETYEALRMVSAGASATTRQQSAAG